MTVLLLLAASAVGYVTGEAVRLTVDSSRRVAISRRFRPGAGTAAGTQTPSGTGSHTPNQNGA